MQSEDNEKAYASEKNTERVTCIDVKTPAERSLLARGPKFVPSRGRATKSDLKAVETNIETAVNALRWLGQKEREKSTNSGMVMRADNPEEKDSGADEDGNITLTTTCLLQDPKLLRLKVHNGQVSQTEKLDMEMEQRISCLKMDILRAYVHHTPDKRNIDQKENKALRSLRQRAVAYAAP